MRHGTVFLARSSCISRLSCRCPIQAAAHTDLGGWSLLPKQETWCLPWKQLLESCCCVCFCCYGNVSWQQPCTLSLPLLQTVISLHPLIHPSKFLATCRYISLVVGLPKHSLGNPATHSTEGVTWSLGCLFSLNSNLAAPRVGDNSLGRAYGALGGGRAGCLTCDRDLLLSPQQL